MGHLFSNADAEKKLSLKKARDDLVYAEHKDAKQGDRILAIAPSGNNELLVGAEWEKNLVITSQYVLFLCHRCICLVRSVFLISPSTSRYTPWNFLYKNLYLQFSDGMDL